MCKYCEIDDIENEAKRHIRKNQRVTIKIVRNMLNKNLYYLEVDTNSYQKEEIDIKYCPFCRKEVGRVKRHASGYWYQFIIPKRLTLPPTRIYRWLNFYWRLKNKEDKQC